MEGLRPTQIHLGKRLLPAQQGHDKSDAADGHPATCTIAGHVSHSPNRHQQHAKEEICNQNRRKRSDWQMFGVSIRRNTQVRRATFAFRAMSWSIHSLLMLLHAG